MAIGIPFDSRAVSYTFEGDAKTCRCGPCRSTGWWRRSQPLAREPSSGCCLVNWMGPHPSSSWQSGIGFWIQDGHHRAYAAMLLGRETVEAYIRPPVTSSVREVRERDSLPFYEDGIPTRYITTYGTDSGPFTRIRPARRGSATDDGLLGAGSTRPKRSPSRPLEDHAGALRPLRAPPPDPVPVRGAPTSPGSSTRAGGQRSAGDRHHGRSRAPRVRRRRVDYSPSVTGTKRSSRSTGPDPDPRPGRCPAARHEEVAEPDLSYLLAPSGRTRRSARGRPGAADRGISATGPDRGTATSTTWTGWRSARSRSDARQAEQRVVNVWTAPEARRHGYATALLQQRG